MFIELAQFVIFAYFSTETFLLIYSVYVHMCINFLLPTLQSFSPFVFVLVLLMTLIFENYSLIVFRSLLLLCNFFYIFMFIIPSSL